ncbi:hypothetical protein GCM10022210_36490 [Mucilaginibacter dorajii]|uniref:Protein YjdM C-terminal domain-containing protein n=2 Tax=Mucilaginibacter dorajii TaxID=692994 RepID=A0ABP7QGK9_9SPHI
MAAEFQTDTKGPGNLSGSFILLKLPMETSNVKDSNGNILNDGDSVTLIKSLKVKGGGVTLKQGTLVKKIRLTDDDKEVDCKIDGMSIVLKTEFLKKR